MTEDSIFELGLSLFCVRAMLPSALLVQSRVRFLQEYVDPEATCCLLTPWLPLTIFAFMADYGEVTESLINDHKYLGEPSIDLTDLLGSLIALSPDTCNEASYSALIEHSRFLFRLTF